MAVLGFIPSLFLNTAFARTDLSISVTDITFSKDNPLKGEEVRVFARVFNLGDTDVYGFVVFTENGKEMADPQPISVKANAYDDVFIDWAVTSGAHNVQAKIVQTNLQDDNIENNEVVREDYFVDLDTDGDGTGNTSDSDDDGDELSDEEENNIGTNCLLPDTDGDEARDNIDAFPLDSDEWQDTDADGFGNNADLDDDGDELSDEDETFILGSNPLSRDTDQDGLTDSKELSLGTELAEEDSDKDGTADSEDYFPLDASKSQASMFESLSSLFKSREIASEYVFWGVIASPFVIFIILRKRR
jgi:hypothetical protein